MIWNYVEYKTVSALEPRTAVEACVVDRAGWAEYNAAVAPADAAAVVAADSVSVWEEEEDFDIVAGGNHSLHTVDLATTAGAGSCNQHLVAAVAAVAAAADTSTVGSACCSIAGAGTEVFGVVAVGIDCESIVVRFEHTVAGNHGDYHFGREDTTLSLPDFTIARLHFTF